MAQKKRMGRPAAKVKTVAVSARIPEPWKAMLEEMAAADERPLGMWLRRHIRKILVDGGKLHDVEPAPSDPKKKPAKGA